MKLIAVNGSPRTNGNTASLIDKVIEGCLSTTEAQVEKINITEKNIGYCTGCLSCTFPPPGTGKCVLDDDMTGILESLKTADAFIFGTPNHMRTVSAPLLVFFSRMLPLMQFVADKNEDGNVIGGTFITPMKGKKAAVVISQGDPICSSQLVYEVLERNLMDMGLRRVGDIISRANMTPGDAAKKEDDMQKAFQLGVNLHRLAGLY